MRAGKRGVDQFPDVGVALMHGQLVAVLGDLLDRVDVAKIEAGIDPLREQVQGHRDDVDVAGALAVAEQRALDPLGAGHQRELRRRHGGAAIVVRVNRKDHARTVGYAPPEPLELVGVGVRRRHLDGRREVEDEPPRSGRLDDLLDRLADVEREVELGAGETLGRILELKVRPVGGLGERLDLPCAALTAISVTPLRSVLKTTSRCNVEVEL